MSNKKGDKKKDIKKEDVEVLEDVLDEKVEEKSIEEKLNDEITESKNNYLRLAADFDNYRKRNIANLLLQKEVITTNIISEFLPLADNYELALKYLDEKSKEGVLMIYRQLLDIFAKFDVKEMNVLFEPFDPKYHEAVEKVKNTEAKSGTVVEVTQKGYMIGKNVLRCAMVKIAE